MRAPFKNIDVFLEPGELYVTGRPCVVKTILGSCVAICLYDRKAHVGGINHYVLPTPAPNDPPSGRYGTCSIERLVEKMLRCGASKMRLRAGVFGGARPLGGENGPQVGAANRAIGIELLKRYTIPVMREETGGTLGRRVFFNIATGQVVTSMIERNPALWVRPVPGGGV